MRVSSTFLLMVLFVLFGLTLLAGGAALPRSRAIIREFARTTGYPNGRPGYVVDHQIPLCAGGADALVNLQWQERRASYVKDMFERELCKDMARMGLKMVPKD